MFLLRAGAVCAFAIASDYAFTLYVRRAGEGRAVSAALWSCAIAIFGSLNVVSYVADHRLIVPMVLGYYLGTWLAVRHDSPALPDRSTP